MFLTRLVFQCILLSTQRVIDNYMENIYLMKDVSRVSGQSIHTIKYYLKIGLLREIGRSPETNFRYFNDTTLERLKKIRQLRVQRKSIKDIKRELDN